MYLASRPAMLHLKEVVFQHICNKYTDAKVQSVRVQMDAAVETDASDGEPDSSPAKLARSLTVFLPTFGWFVGRCSFKPCKHMHRYKHTQTLTG